MDNKPDSPEKKRDDIEDILEIMRKRNTKIVISESTDNKKAKMHRNTKFIRLYVTKFKNENKPKTANKEKCASFRT